MRRWRAVAGGEEGFCVIGILGIVEDCKRGF